MLTTKKMSRTVVLASLALGTVACVVGGGIWWGAYKKTSSVESIQGRAPIEIHADWQRQTQRILSVYEQDKDVAKALGALLELTVIQEDRDTHLALILALEARRQNQPDADARFAQAMAKFTGAAL